MKTKNILSLSLVLLYINICVGQSYISKTVLHDGYTRQYEVYVPSIYNASSHVPLIFNFHGGSDNIASQIAIADMSTIADTANFIVVYPQALPDPNDGGSTNWIHKDPTNIDDVLFIDALIDTLSFDYLIDTNRIYACGYSLGGEFTYELGCRLNNRVSAIGVVARTMQTYTLNNCSPVHPTGVLTILGTADGISDYNGVWWGGIQYYVSADQMHDFWVNYNNCDTLPVISSLPDINTSDGSTVESYSWADANGCIYVEHLKVIGGGHDWPGSYGNMDINATEAIWNFVSSFDINGKASCAPTNINDVKNKNNKTRVFPNPFTDKIIIDIAINDKKEFKIYSNLGKLVLKGIIDKRSQSIDLSPLPQSVYLLKCNNQSFKIIKTR